MVGRLLFVAALVSVAPSLARAQAGASLDAPAASPSHHLAAGPRAAELPSLNGNLSDQEPLPMPRHPVSLIAAGVPLMAVGLGVGITGAWGVAQPGCSPGAWICIDPRPLFGAMAAVGGVLFMVSVGLLLHGATRWADVDREREERARAGDLAFDGRGVGVRF